MAHVEWLPNHLLSLTLTITENVHGEGADAKGLGGLKNEHNKRRNYLNSAQTTVINKFWHQRWVDDRWCFSFSV